MQMMNPCIREGPGYVFDYESCVIARSNRLRAAAAAVPHARARAFHVHARACAYTLAGAQCKPFANGASGC